jgi:hypothetical protein
MGEGNLFNVPKAEIDAWVDAEVSSLDTEYEGSLQKMGPDTRSQGVLKSRASRAAELIVPRW